MGLPTPFLRFHNAPTGTSSGRSPLLGTAPHPHRGHSHGGDKLCTVHIPRMPTADELAVSPIPESFRYFLRLIRKTCVQLQHFLLWLLCHIRMYPLPRVCGTLRTLCHPLVSISLAFPFRFSCPISLTPVRCPLCLDLLDQPVTTVPCGHTFCEACILRAMEDAGDLSPTSLACGAPAALCPVCRAVVREDRLGPSWIVRELVNALLIRCDYGVSYDFETKSYEHGVSEEAEVRMGWEEGRGGEREGKWLFLNGPEHSVR